VLTAIVKKIFANLWADFRKFWWVLLLLLVYYLITRLLLPLSCPIFLVIGLPCPGCGMSRALRSLLTLQFAQAFHLNPLSFVIAAFAIYCLFYRYVKSKAIPAFLPLFIALFVLLVLFYLVRMYLYFPERIPYVYHYGNPLEHFIPGYRAFILGG
jgi:hypothetical protein